MRSALNALIVGMVEAGGAVDESARLVLDRVLHHVANVPSGASASAMISPQAVDCAVGAAAVAVGF